MYEVTNHEVVSIVNVDSYVFMMCIEEYVVEDVRKVLYG